MDTQFLAFQLPTGCAVIEIAGSHDHHAESQFSHGVGVLSRCIHHADLVGSSGFQVHVVVSGTGTNDNLQLLGGIQDFGIHLVATDDDGIHVLHGIQQLRLVGIFLQENQLIAPVFFHYLTDTIHCYRSKRFLCCY